MTRPSSTARDHARERGQVIVIFAGGIVLFMLLLAIVVDVSWYWANTLRVQRAADAAALAGVVWLPDCPDSSIVGCASPKNARDTAKAEAKKNGYVDGANGTTITTSSDPDNSRRLIVKVSADVGTYFMKVIGINSIAASRNAKAEFMLPVPMGSPQNYFGVGQFLGTTKHGGTVTNTTYSDTDSGWNVATSAPAPTPAVWTPGSGTLITAVNGHDNIRVRSDTNNSTQQWGNFGFTSGLAANQTVTAINGIEVKLTGVSLNANCPATTNNIGVALSWDSGTSWTPSTNNTANLVDTTDRDYSFGSTSSVAAWASGSWTPADISDTHFRVRLTAVKGCTTATTRIRLDMLEVRVSYKVATTTTTTTPITYDENAAPTAINDPVSGSVLAPQNFWGAIFTKGGVRQNGDYFAPANLGGSASGSMGPVSYDPNGYDYTVDLTGSTGGQVRLFDPIFCATGANKTSGWYGAGDHWTTLGSSGNTVVAPVAVTFTLWDMGPNPYSKSDDTLVPGATLPYDPLGKTLGDFSGSVGNPTTNQADSTHNGIQNVGRSDAEDCATRAGHNEWVTLASGLAGGMYRVNVETSSQAGNASVGAENLFSIWVNGTGGKARVYGGGRMAGYTQVGAQAQSFFLSQIKADAAGKILEIRLFDPGDVAGNAWLHIKSPDGNSYNDATFSYQADIACNASRSDVCSAANRTSMQTAKNGSSSFDGSVITITIPLPDSYGSGGLTPSDPGNPNGEAGWWKIYYDVTNANDTTTWQVDIRGNPVHLVVP